MHFLLFERINYEHTKRLKKYARSYIENKKKEVYFTHINNNIIRNYFLGNCNNIQRFINMLLLKLLERTSSSEENKKTTQTISNKNNKALSLLNTLVELIIFPFSFFFFF